MKLCEFVNDNRDAMFEAWCAAAASVYPTEMRSTGTKNGADFSNPCGQNLCRDLDAFLSALEEGASSENLARCLYQTIKIRSIQPFLPSLALKFIFDLKEILLRLYEERFRGGMPFSVWSAWSLILDGAARAAFDVYEMERRLLGDIRINEIKRQVAGLAARSRFFEEGS